MKDMLTKGFYTGLGAGILLKDQIMNLLNAPVRVDDVPAQELRAQLTAVLQGISDQVGKSTQDLQHVGEQEFSDLLGRIGLAKTEDMDALKARIAELEVQLRRDREEHTTGEPHPTGKAPTGEAFEGAAHAAGGHGGGAHKKKKKH